MATMAGDRGLYRALLTDRRFGLVLLVTAAGTVGNLFPPALPAIALGLGVSDGTVGAIVTAYKLPSILVIPVAAVVADLYGRRTVLLPSLVLYGAGGVALFFLSSFTAILAVTLLVGIGAAAVYPLSVTLLGDFFDTERNAAGQGLRVGLIGLAAIAIPAATGFLAGVRWNLPFLLFGIVLAVAAIVAVALVDPIEAPTRGTSVRDALSEYGGSIRIELADPALAVLLAGGFVRGFSRYALLTFVPVFAVSILDASLLAAGLVLSARGFVYVAVAPLSGAFVARVDRKTLHLVALAISGGALLALPAVPSVSWLAAVVGLHTIGDAVFDPVNKGTVTAMARREYRAGVVNALYVLKRIGQAAAPVAFGLLLAATGYGVMFAAAALVVGGYMAAFAALFVYRPVGRAER